jgi:hypothetical protein
MAGRRVTVAQLLDGEGLAAALQEEVGLVLLQLANFTRAKGDEPQRERESARAR